MRGFRFLLLMSVVVLGFGPATAQDVFVNKYKRADSELNTRSKPSLYVSRGQYERGNDTRSSSRKVKVKSRQQDKVALARNARNVADKIDVFYAWQNSERKPKTQEEILSYADSKRALIEGSIMQRKQKLIARLEQQDRDRAMSAVRSGRNLPGDSSTPRSAYTGRNTNTTKRVTITKPKVYRSGDDSSNTGVYKNYR